MSDVAASLAAAVAAAACRAALAAAAAPSQEQQGHSFLDREEMSDAEMGGGFDDDDVEFDEESVQGELTSESSREAFVAYLEEKHPLLVHIFPIDSTVIDLFNQVEQRKSIDEFFDEITDAAARRALRRLENEIGQRLKEEVHLERLKDRREKRLEIALKAKNKKRKWKQLEEPEALPTMSLDEAAAAKLLAADKQAQQQREKVLKKGYTFRGQLPKPTPTGQEHIEFFRNSPRTVVESSKVPSSSPTPPTSTRSACR